MRRFVLTLSLVSLAALLSVTAIAVSAAPLQPRSPATSSFTLKGSIAGGITSTELGDPLTFVFTETNQSSAPASEFLHVTQVVSANHVLQACVLPNGFEFGPDGTFCEPGPIKPGQSSRAVIQLTATNAASQVSVRVCLVNENTGASGPCLTVSVKRV